LDNKALTKAKPLTPVQRRIFRL